MNIDTASICAIMNIIGTPQMRGIIIGKLPAPASTPSTKYCVGQFGCFSSVRRSRYQEQRSDTDKQVLFHC
jgi:hypothetical protein